MNDIQDLYDDGYDPAAVRARIGHLSCEAQREVEQISRILRAAFGYGEAEMPEQGRIVRIALTGLCPDSIKIGDTITGYDFHITVNLPECIDEAHWRFACRLIASEIGSQRPVTLSVDMESVPVGIVVYDAETDVPLNARELSLKP